MVRFHDSCNRFDIGSGPEDQVPKLKAALADGLQGLQLTVDKILDQDRGFRHNFGACFGSMRRKREVLGESASSCNVRDTPD